jgi:hypothetical protein
LCKYHARWRGKLNLPPAKGAFAKESNVEMFRNMEVVLMLCFGLIVTAALLAQPAGDDAEVRAQSSVAEQIPVVVITGKRLSNNAKAQPSGTAG